MKNDDDFIHLPELYIKLGTLKEHLKKTYNININTMDNSIKDINWTKLEEGLKRGGYDDEKMAMNSCDIIYEYAIKLDKIVKEDTELEEWVKSKLSKAEDMLSDIKHVVANLDTYDHGGELFKQQLLHIAKYSLAIMNELKKGTELMSWMESNLAICADYMDSIYHHLDYKMGNRAKDVAADGTTVKGKSDKEKMAVDFMIALEESDIMASGSHKNQKAVDTIKSIVTMPKSEFSKYIKENPNPKINMIYNEFQDWKQTYKNGGGVSETPIAMMREVTGKAVGTVSVSEEIYSSQVNDFVNYVYEVYEEQGYTKAQVKTAVNKYIKDLGKEFTYGGGDSLDRERVYEYLLNPSLKGIKNPMMRDGGGVDGDSYQGGEGIGEKADILSMLEAEDLDDKGISSKTKYVFLADAWDGWLDNGINSIRLFNSWDEAKSTYIKYLKLSNYSQGEWVIALYKIIPGKKADVYIKNNVHYVLNAKKIHEFDYMQGLVESVKVKGEEFVIKFEEDEEEYFANGGGIERLNRRKGESNNDMFSRMSKEVAERHEHEDWGDDYETLFKEFLAKKYPSITYTDYQNLPKKQQEKITNEYIDYSFDNDQSLGRGMRFKDGGGVGQMNNAKSYWNMFDKNKRVDFLIGAGYSKSVAEDLGNEDWDSLEAGVHKDLLSSIMANGGNVGRDAMFRSQEPHEQRYNRKREWKEYKKDNWLANDWFDNGGGVGAKYYVMDAKSGEVVSKGFDTEEEAKVEKFRMFEETGNIFLTQKMMANGGGVGNQGLLNKNYLDSIPAEKKAFILKGIAEHYGISVKKVLEEVTSSDAEELADYIMGRGALEVFNAMKSMKMTNGGNMMAAQGMFLDGEFEETVRKVKDYISKYPYVWKNGNKSYVPIEGWQYAASLMGLSARVTEVYAVPEKNGWMAKAEVVNQTGVIVCSGFGFVGRDEEKWAKSTESDLESFSQTKAVSRALRNCISYLIKAAGYSTTPAEEMYGLKGSSKSMNSKKPNLRPIYGVPDIDGQVGHYDMPVQKPIEKASTEERSNLSILLQKVWAESKGRGMVIVSPEFMDKIEGTLFDADATDLVFEVLLTDAYDWMIKNNIVLRSKIFMKEIAKAINNLGN